MNSLNHLANENSPYLQQHAHNPVNWYPWTKEALDQAKKENKPILLSIGYAACHWCHVMAHESFEDAQTAKLMNELFINIKVDREERPDLDKVYQTAHYLLTQRNGGWPLTIFLMPDDLAPFFSGTYFPREAKYQLPAFKDVLRTIADIYKENKKEIQQQNQQLIAVLNQKSHETMHSEFTNAPIALATTILQKKLDPRYGGFNGAPKFPNAPKLEFLLEKNPTAALNTFMRMAEGGIYDQIQGGFFRYSVDEKWEIPHFEKMLYDNAQLLFLYALASRQFNEIYFATVARETADWIIAKMQSPEGGYYSSLDADSEGEEGKYYVWNKFAIEEILSVEEAQFAEKYFDFTGPPNFENHWHLHVVNKIENPTLLASIKQKLLAARDLRVPPALDNKILTAWNALMIKGMATAGDILQEPRYIVSAEQALKCIQQHLWKNNRLLASYKSHLTAYLDDYAYLLDALLTLLQIQWRTDYLNFAIALADNLLMHFEDKDNGGFFFTADDQEKVLYRPKTMMDEVIPSGNAVAANALLMLGHLLGETRYIDTAEKTLHSAWPALSQLPAEHCGLLLALQAFLVPPKIIVIRGTGNDLQHWQMTYKNQDRSNKVFAIPKDETHLPGLLDTRKPQGDICAYVCQGTTCLPVVTAPPFLSFPHKGGRDA